MGPFQGYFTELHNKQQQILSLLWNEKKKITSNYSNTNIQMYDTGAKRSEHHARTNHHPADHNHWSAAIAVDKDTAHWSCTKEEGHDSFNGYFTALKIDLINFNKGQNIYDKSTLPN